MIEKLCSKSSITADTAFRKDLPCRGAPMFPYTLDQPPEETNRMEMGYLDTTVPRTKAS